MNSPKQECQLVKLHLRYQDRNIGAQSNSTVTEKNMNVTGEAVLS